MRNKHFSPKGIGLAVGLTAFIVLSAMAGGIIEVSMDIGLGRWLWESAVYAVTNKALEKLLISAGLGLAVAFVASMIQYGKQVKEHRVGRKTQVHFDNPTSSTLPENTRQAG